MASQKSPVRKLLEAQYVLKEAVLDEISDIQVAIRSEKDSKTVIQLKRKQDTLAVQFRQLQTQSVAIIAAETDGDLLIIQAVSADIQKFIMTTKKVAKTIKVVIALIVFVAAAMAQDPKTIAQAATELYKAINETIDDEAKKGNKAAFIIPKVKIPSIITKRAKVPPPVKLKAKSSGAKNFSK